MPSVHTEFVQYDSVRVVNTDVETTLLHATAFKGRKILPANYFQPGRVLRFTLRGWEFDGAGSSGNQQLRIYLGGTVILDTAANPVAGIAFSPGWDIVADIVCQVAGVGGQLWAQGHMLRLPAGALPSALRSMTPTALVAIDTTIALAMDVTALFSVASADNNMTCTNATIEVLDHK
jgi:hypothetical protein